MVQLSTHTATLITTMHIVTDSIVPNSLTYDQLTIEQAGNISLTAAA